MKTFLIKAANWFYNNWETLLMFALFAVDVWFVYMLSNDCLADWLKQFMAG